MYKEFDCTHTPDCRPFELRFPSYDQFTVKLAAGEIECPVCGEPPVVMVSRTAPPKFKGSGFYQTDYKG